MSVRVGVAIGGWPFADTATADPFWAFVERAEELGFDSLWITDRLISRSIFLEPLAAMAAAAGRTQRLKFGPAVLVLPLRNPVLLAKEIATIDFLSGGRMLPAFGIGGDEQQREYEAAGVRKEERGARSDEMVTVLRRLWSEERVTHHGRFYHLTDATIAPRPLQRELPVWFGGRSEAAFRRVGRLGDGWLASFITPEEFAAGAACIKRYAAEAGRAIDEDHYGMIVTTCVAGSIEEARARLGPAARRADIDPAAVSLLGTPADCVAQMQRYLDAGCSKFVLRPAGPPETILPQLEIIAREIAPSFDRTMAKA